MTLEDTKSVATIAGGSSASMRTELYRWRRAFVCEGVAAFPVNGHVNSEDEESHRLRRELKRVTEERDV